MLRGGGVVCIRQPPRPQPRATTATTTTATPSFALDGCHEVSRARQPPAREQQSFGHH
jgi:hypothetical protein